MNIEIRIEGAKGKTGKYAVAYAVKGLKDNQDLIIDKIDDDVYYIVIKDLKKKKKYIPIENK